MAERILRTFAACISHGLVPNSFPDRPDQPLDRGSYNTVDATLWFFQALAEHRAASGSDALVRELVPRLEAILDHHVAGTWFGIRMDPADGLLSAGEGETQLTWMDAKPRDRAITPRHGKAVEVNALWVNALRSMTGFARLTGADPGRWETLADRAAASFQRFWNPRLGCCFDVIDGPSGCADDRLRPNQLLALSLHLGAAGLGSLSEIFDGDAPHDPRGCIAQAWSVAQVLAAWTAISEGSPGGASISGGTPRPPRR